MKFDVYCDESIGRRFKNDTERLEKLFELYTKMTVETGKRCLVLLHGA